MTNVSYGPGLPFFGYADTAYDAMDQNLTRLPNILFSYESSTLAIGDFRSIGQPGLQTIFYGYGFTYNSVGGVNGGVITAMQSNLNGAMVSLITGAAIPVQTLLGWVIRDDYVTADNTLFGGNDVFYAPTGYSVFNGYTGIDTVVLPDASHQDTLTGRPTVQATISSADISESLTAIERLQFVDGTMYYDDASPAAQIVRLYQAALGRAPDASGLAAWTSMLNGGAPLTQLAAGFINSAEFQSRFSGVSGNPTLFVTQLYANVLHRTPDLNGLVYWTVLIQQGTSQAQVLTDFSESTENKTNTSSLTAPGVWVANEQAASVARLYYTTLNRAPDAAGLDHWTSLLPTMSLQQEASQFMAGAEFQQRYGGLSNGDFVNVLYHNVLNRAPSGADAASWTAMLNSGADRAGVVVGFSESAEHQAILMPKIEAAGIVLG